MSSITFHSSPMTSASETPYFSSAVRVLMKHFFPYSESRCQYFSVDNKIECILHHQSIQLRHCKSSQLRSGIMCSHSVRHPVFGYNEKRGCSKMFLVSVCAFFLILDGSSIKHVPILYLSQPQNYQKSLIRKTLICLELFLQTMVEYFASRIGYHYCG